MTVGIPLSHESWVQLISACAVRYLQRLIIRLELKSGLDIGCGKNSLVAVLRDHGFRSTGMDGSVARLQGAELAGVHGAYILADVTTFDFGSLESHPAAGVWTRNVHEACPHHVDPGSAGARGLARSGACIPERHGYLILTMPAQKLSLLYVTDYSVDSAPHAEWSLWILANAGWNVECMAVGASNSILKRVVGGSWTSKDLYPSGTSGLSRELRLWCALLQARLRRFDVVVLDSPAIAYRAAFLWCLPGGKAKLVYQARDFVDPRQWRLRSLLEGILLRRAALHINLEYHRAYIYRTLHRARCPVVLLPPNLPASWPVPEASERVRAQLAGEAGRKVFLLRLHGGFSELRRTTELLLAMTLLPDHIRLVMQAGPPSGDPEVQELLERLGPRVVRLPWLDFCRMLEYTPCCDAGVLLYANNDLGNFFQCPGRFTEYLACGLPLLASNFTGLTSLVRAYDVGVVVDAGDPHSIARGITELEQRRRSGDYSSANIRKRFEQHFALEHWAPTLVEAFRRLLGHTDADPSFILRDGWVYTGPRVNPPWQVGSSH